MIRELSPYILKATALIGVQRKVGGNQFRHGFATLGILLDYKYYDDPILLKASVLHDIVEELGEDLTEIRNIDSDGDAVAELILEVSKNINETKEEYLQRLKYATINAKRLKCADRISNLTDLHLGIHTNNKISDYLIQTEKYIIPLAYDVNDFSVELIDLINKRKNTLY
jgi:hypothetical protein